MKTRLARRNRRLPFRASPQAACGENLLSRRRRLALEWLEDRRLLAVDPFPVPLAAMEPLGSLIYDSSVRAEIAAPDEFDGFTIDLDDHQRITLVVDPDASLQPLVGLMDPSGAPIDGAAAAAPGEDAVLQVAATTGAGTYTVTVGGEAGTTGAFTVQLILNAAVEEEEHNGPANDDSTSAQDLDAGFLSLGTGSADRAAVVGKLPLVPPTLVARERFPSGVLSDQWTVTSSQPEGRIQITDEFSAAGWPYALLMDRDPAGEPNLNEAVWTVDLSRTADVTMSFYHAEWGDEPDAFDGLFTGSYPADGVAISSDGVTWHPVWNAPDQTDSEWRRHTIDLSAAAAAGNVTLGPDFRIKFQQYDDEPLTADGRGYDEIVIIAAAPIENDWYRFTLDDGQAATLALATPAPADDVALELYDANRQLLAGGRTSYNLEWVISDFVDRTDDAAPAVYYARVAGISEADYSLLLTRGAGFDTEPNDGPGKATQDLSPHGAVLGHLGFQRSTEHQKFTVSDGNRYDRFGGCVSISGDTAIIGANGDDDYGSGSGSTYLFHFDGSQWTEQQKLTASDADSGDYFGSSLSISGDAAIVGADGSDDNGSGSGSAYVFHFDGGQCSEQQKLTASDAESGDRFGGSVSIGGDTAIVGAPGNDDNGSSSGSAYVFHFDGSHWVEQQKLIASDAESDDYFGRSLSISGDTAIIGAYGDDDYGSRSGSAYVFRFDGSHWVEQQKLTAPDAESNDCFGLSVSIHGDTAIIGAYGDDDYGSSSGSAYVFRFDGSQWTEQQKLTASDAEGSDCFAWSVSIHGDTAIIGAYGDDHHGAYSGSAYVFGFDGSRWFEQQKLVASDADADDELGYSVAIGSDFVIAGAVGDESDTGAAYFFTAFPVDDYRVEVQAGDPLIISTSTPGDAPGEFRNTLDPVVELYDPGGTWVAEDDNGAPDGRNARLTHTAAATGTYTVRLRAAGNTAGEYVLSVSGPSGGPAPFEVAATDPADGTRFTSPPGWVLVDCNDPVLAGTLEASDLTLNEVPATSATMLDHDTLVFGLPAAFSEGPNLLAIAAGSIRDLQGTPIEPFAATLVLDTTAPRIIASSLLEGDVTAAGTLTYTARFDEELDATALDANDMSLVGLISGTYPPTVFDYQYDPAGGSSLLTLEFAGLADDVYTLTLRSGDGAFQDLLGYDLDGEPHPVTTVPSGDGLAGGDFVVSFLADTSVLPFPVPLQAQSPRGSLVYEGSINSRVDPAGDRDSFTIELDDPQTITVVVDPEATLRPTIELSDPSGALLGTATAGVAGEDAVLQVAATVGAGTYTVRVGGAPGTTGVYAARIILNAAVEQEEHDGPRNNDWASAWDLDAGFVPLGGGPAQRAAVLGTRPSPSGRVVDQEEFWSRSLDRQWTTYSSEPEGRIQLTGEYGAAGGPFALLMDCDSAGDGNLNEAIWTVGLSGVNEATLSFFHAEWSDEENGFDGDFVDHYNADGVAISDDGVNWHPIWDSQPQVAGVWEEYTFDLAAAAAEAGMTLGPNFRIKFQQYDDDPLPYDGRGYDEIRITTAAPADDDWYRFTLDDGDSASLALTTPPAPNVPTPSNLRLELYDDHQNLLATGVEASNVEAVINDFVDATSDGDPETYFIRVTGDSGSDYTLVVTRNADFDTEPNDGIAGPQDVHASGTVLAHLGVTAGEIATEWHKLTASDAFASDHFGSSVSISGDTALVGADGDDNGAQDAGSAYIFQFDGCRWNQQQKLTPADAQDYQVFGLSVALNGTIAVVGAPDFNTRIGSAYVFQFDGSQWIEQQKLTPSDAHGVPLFGLSVAIDGNTILVGAPQDDQAGAWSGAVYVFQRVGNQWVEQQKLVASDATNGAEFGWSVALSGSTAVVGAPYEQIMVGSAYVFQFDGSQWVEQQKLSASDGGDRQYFGASVALSETTAIVGAPEYGHIGSAYLFQLDGSQWIEQQKLSPRNSIGDTAFGSSVAISGDTAVVGASRDDAGAQDAGAAYLFHFDGSQWIEEQQVFASDADKDDEFGYSVALSDGTAIIGALLGEENTTDSGAAYIFTTSLWDDFAVGVQAGDPLVIGTATPGDGPGQFDNQLDPVIGLFDPTGMFVAGDDNGAPDGRNARLTHAAAMTGTYTVRVLAAGPAAGEYVLNVDGHTGTLPNFRVTATDPAEGDLFTSAPTSITVEFNDSLLLSSLDASDLTVDGVPAPAVTLVNANTVRFELPFPLAHGLHHVTIGGGAILDLQGTPLDPFATSFTLDIMPPHVIESSILSGDVVPAAPLVYTARFDRELIAGRLEASDIELRSRSSGVPFPATLDYDPVTSTLTLQFADLPEDEYRLILRSGDGRFEDLMGHDLDGEPHSASTVPSGDGWPGGDFFVNFSTDATSTQAQPFERLQPLGSLMSLSEGNHGLLNLAGDEDDFTFFAHAGETISAVVYPDDPAATLSVELPGLAGPFSAAAAGQPAVLSAVPIPADGTYAVRVSGDMFGTYRLEIRKNLAAEILDTDDGNELPIDSSLVPLGSDRYGVLGRNGPESIELIVNGGFETGDFTGWTATSNGMAELTPWTVGPAGGGFFFNSSPLAGTYSAYNGFDGEAGLQYELYQEVTFPAEIHAATLRTNHRIVYSSGGTGTEPREFHIFVRDTDNQLLSLLYSETIANYVRPETDRGWKSGVFDLSAYAGQTIRIHFLEMIPDSYAGPALIEFDEISLTVAEAVLDPPDVDEYTIDLTGKAGQPIDVILAGQEGIDFSGQLLELLDVDGTTVLAQGQADPLGVPAENYDLGILDFVVPADGIYTLRVTSSVGGRYGMLVSDRLTFDMEPNDGQADPLRSLDATHAALGYLDSGEVDSYTLTLAAGETVLIHTETPCDNPVATPGNVLDPMLRLFDPSSTLVASDLDTEDGRNARLVFTAAVAGTYTIEVEAEVGAGEYLLSTEILPDPLPWITIDDVAVFEGDGGAAQAVFTVRLTEDLAAPVTVRLDTLDGTATVADGDYLPISDLLLTFEPGGGLTQQVAVDLLGDARLEPAETFSVQLRDAAGGILADPHGVGTILNDDAEIVDRYVFYNHSAFDGEDPAADEQDDGAIAPDKVALLPGETATFANYTSYSGGINGVMVDVTTLPEGSEPAVADFRFRVGNDNDPAGWSDAPAPLGISLRAGEGVDGSDRVTIIWADNAIRKQWLQVTVLAGGDMHLAQDDVFYFGNAIGESGNSTTDAKVNASDMLAARNNPRTFVDPAPVDFNYDYNRDARVNATDMLIARNYQTNFLTALKLITAPGEKAAKVENPLVHDAVLERVAGRESPRREILPSRLDWLYEFEQFSAHRESSRKDKTAGEILDKLLTAERP